jgi:hypothetical protein
VNDSDVALALVLSLESQEAAAEQAVDQDVLIVQTELSDKDEEDDTLLLPVEPPTLPAGSAALQQQQQQQRPESPPAMHRMSVDMALDAELAWRLMNQEEEQQQRERRRQTAQVEREEQKLRRWLLKGEQRALKEAARGVKEQRKSREAEQKFRLKRESKEAPLPSLLPPPLLRGECSCLRASLPFCEATHRWIP